MAILELVSEFRTLSFVKTGINCVDLTEAVIDIYVSGDTEPFCVDCGSDKYAASIYKQIIQAIKIEHDTSITISPPIP